jgi:16S rRNA (uracil1498-N3)-methyltransferase
MFDCLVTSVGRSEAVCRIEGVRENVGEPRVSVTLALSLLKNPARFDVAVEKVTELGVRTIVPIICERTVGRRPRMDRLAGIALAAMKQSGRCVLPEIAPSASFRELVTSARTHGLRLLPHERAGSEEFIDSVIARHQDAASVVVAIGPEGGFTEEEVSEATAAGFMVVSLGPRRLRAETAAIRAVSYIVGRE